MEPTESGNCKLNSSKRGSVVGFQAVQHEQNSDNKLSLKKLVIPFPLSKQLHFITNNTEPIYEIEFETLTKLKESTQNLLCLVEEIQSKLYTKLYNPVKDESKRGKLRSLLKPEMVNVSPALKELEDHTKALDSIHVQDEDDNCSIYKRLTRKCFCLNKHEYNDFVIHFNEDKTYYASNVGEIIKNLKILKKFLYMGSDYTKNSLTFLNEGLSSVSDKEKEDIALGCAHSDICNVFEQNSIVEQLILAPRKYDHVRDDIIQGLAADFLNKLSVLEEGRRYLNYSSKIYNDIRKALKIKEAKLDYSLLEPLNATLNYLDLYIGANLNVTYFSKLDEGAIEKTLSGLTNQRKNMTLQQIFTEMEFLIKLSECERLQKQITQKLPDILTLFQALLKEYDNSELNKMITHILNNIVSENGARRNLRKDSSKNCTVANIATEPVLMKNVAMQITVRKLGKNEKKLNRSNLKSSDSNESRQSSMVSEPRRSLVVKVPTKKKK